MHIMEYYNSFSPLDFRILAKKYKFINKNDLLCAWRELKKTLCGKYTYDSLMIYET